MKKIILFLLLAFCQITAEDAGCCKCYVKPIIVDCCCVNGIPEATGRFFMFTHPINQRIEVAQALIDNLIHNKKGPLFGSVEITAAYQKTVSCPDDSKARYFLFNCKNSLFVAGDDAPDGYPDLDNQRLRDIRAEWLGLPSDFKGRFSITPEQRQLGFTLTYNQDLHPVFDIDLFEGWWISISAPVVQVTNDLNLRQFDIQNQGTTFPGTIIEALNQPNWLYAHIDGKRSTVQLAEINLKLGTTYLSEDNFVITYYSIFSAPTGNTQNARYVFDPVAGNNGHVGIGAGAHFQLLLNRDPLDYAFCFLLGLEGLFLVRHTEMRTLSLVDKPWSRYLLLTAKNGILGNAIPGVNVLTREVRSRPYGIADFEIGFRFKKEFFEAEIGYGIWGHTTEILELRCPFPSDFGILGDPTGITPDQLAPGVYTVTASKSTIKEQAANDTILVGTEEKYNFVPIVQNDLDLRSGAAYRALNNKLFMSIGYTKKTCSTDLILGLGTFFEWPHYNGALQLIGVWVKAGANF